MGQIRIVNRHLLHDKHSEIVRLAAHICPTPAVEGVVFLDEGDPDNLAIYDQSSKEIVIYLKSVFLMALKAAVNPKHPMSLRAETWLAYLQVVFNRFQKICHADHTPMRADLAGVSSVLPGNAELGKLLAYIGIHYDIEPPRIEDDPYFGPLIAEAIEMGLQQQKAWATHQKELLHYICHYPMDYDLYPFFIRDYFRWATGNLNNPAWPQYVPSFDADEDEIQEVRRRNERWREQKQKLAQEREEFQRELEMLDWAERQIEEMTRK